MVKVKSLKLEHEGGSIELRYEKIKSATLTLKSINHKLRSQIIDFLHIKPKATVTQIYVKLRVEQSVVSQHLAILRSADVVTTERNGKFIYYSLNYSRLSEISKFVDSLVSE